MSKFLNNKIFRYLSFLFLNSVILLKSSSSLAAWALKSNGVLELRTNQIQIGFFRRLIK